MSVISVIKGYSHTAVQKVKTSPYQFIILSTMAFSSFSASAEDFDPATVVKGAFDTLTAQVGSMLSSGWGLCITLTVGLLLMRLFKRVTSQAA
ncbi:hypothetical protein REI38_000820 [Salmonella enterica]|uniref:Uncharacterized protein n=1 Tax=Salmonella enterica TaxID=28901 RepID=A0A760MU57_SALER|nr:hypothetical protein [Salmonella enterica]ECI2239428.1 hypothetical protein [Salmonella enterica subsp. enterica]EDG7302021.1 hypothetical protein [Salmonella enterica subsp. enterica serovar Bareilly]EDP9435739.1 hypothetical protein [Salmonella enterica subsp. enterica serovar Irumu]EDY0720110.1 hypothetical protein [Salmonella enterica subsp. enterica]